MNCERCSEILIDYMHEGLDPNEMDEVMEHLRSCAECSREYEELVEIRRAASAESSAPVPSSDVLARLSKAAKEATAGERLPLRKKWSLPQILIPALSATIALSVWFYYGYLDRGYEHEETYSRDVMAQKASPPKAEDELSASAEMAAPQIERQKTLMQNPSGSSLARNAPGEAREELGSSAPAEPPEPETYAMQDTISDNPQSGDMNESIESASQLSSTGRSQVDKTARTHAVQLTLALKQQMEGDCASAVRTNKALLGSTPPPPDYVRAYSYRSLAECYEKMGETKKAVDNYILLMQVSAGEKNYAEGRITELRKSAALKTDEAIPTAGPVESE